MFVASSILMKKRALSGSLLSAFDKIRILIMSIFAESTWMVAIFES